MKLAQSMFAGSDPLISVVSSVMRLAREAQLRWAVVPVTERLKIIRRFRELAANQADPLAGVAAEARRRPVSEVMASEMVPLLDACRFLEQEAGKILATRRPSRWRRPLWLTTVATEIRREPVGVVLVIGPSNYPLLLPGVQVLQAVTAGNAVLLKPGLNGTDSATKLIELLLEAGLDPHLIWLLPESTEAAEAAIENGPDKVLFTGSAHNGQKVLGQLARQVIPSTMELSGSDAVIVRADADLDLTARALVFGITLNNGATCLGPKRVFVARSVATELEGRLAEALRSGFEPASADRRRQLLSPAQAESILPFVRHAILHGAHFISGGIEDDSLIVPLILGGVGPYFPILQSDCFGPVMSIVTVSGDDEAIQRANGCAFALGANVFSRDEIAARRIASRLDAGTVTINDMIVPTADPRVPFGGRKRSGFGTTRGVEGLLDLTTLKVITATRGTFRPAFDPPTPDQTALFGAYLRWQHSSGFRMRWKSFLELVSHLTARRKTKSTP